MPVPEAERPTGMCAFRIAWRVVVLVAIFLGVGFFTSHLLITRAVERGAREYDVRLAGLMGGLFAGGAATVAVGVAMVLELRPRKSKDEGR